MSQKQNNGGFNNFFCSNDFRLSSYQRRILEIYYITREVTISMQFLTLYNFKDLPVYICDISIRVVAISTHFSYFQFQYLKKYNIWKKNLQNKNESLRIAKKYLHIRILILFEGQIEISF